MKTVFKIILSGLWILVVQNSWAANVNTFSLSCQKTQDATTTTSTDGIASFTINNGLPPYTFQLRNVLNVVIQTGTISSETNITAQLNNLKAGTYTITVSDQNSSKTCSFQIGAKACTLNAELADTWVKCSGDKGSLSPSITGGLTPFTYQWSNGAMTRSISNVVPGTYALTISDNAGCTQMLSAKIQMPNSIALFPTISKANDYQSNDGSVKLNVNGGVSSFQLQFTDAQGQLIFNDPNFNSPITLTSLPAGKYLTKVKDKNGCTMEQWLTVGVQICQLAISVQDQLAACTQGENQLSAISNDAGIPPYSYQWMNGSTAQTIGNLSPGTYTVTITDAIGCSHQSQGSIIGNNSMTLSCEVLQHTSGIGAKDGELRIHLGNGTPNYTIDLHNLSSNATTSFATTENGAITIGALYAGNYEMTVKDGNNCTVTCSFLLSDPSCGLVAKVDNAVLSCTETQGTLQAIVTQGVPPYTYRWSNEVTTATNTNLSPGTYTLTVTDRLNCDLVLSAKVLNGFRDEDGDGFYVGCGDFSTLPGPDCNDHDPSIYPGAPEICDGKDNDCNGSSDFGLYDSDGDGVSDCADQCPNDPRKSSPGLCGCGVYEDRYDHDDDGVIGCFDDCPYDALKTEPGNCGCGVPESPDSDGDGVFDCNDACPFNPLKVEKGICGCDAPSIVDIQLKNLSECDAQGTSNTTDDFFFADVYIYFDAAPELGGLTLRGDLNFFHKFKNDGQKTIIVLPDLPVQSSDANIEFITEYKGNEACYYQYEQPNPYINCSQNTCDAPSNIHATVNGNHVQLSWDTLSTAISFEYKYRMSGQQDWIGQWTDQSTVNLCDLVPSADYEFQVRTLCANGFSSTYSSGTFQTETTTEHCFADNRADTCHILDVRFIDIRQCHDRGTIYQSDDYFYADLLVYFDNIPTTGDLIIERTRKKRIPIEDIKNPKVHLIENLKIYERDGILSLKTYFSDQMDCQKSITFTIPDNPCFSGDILPSDSNGKVANESSKTLASTVQVSIGPNPVQAEMTVNYTFKNTTKQTFLLVHNFLGQQKMQTTLNNSTGATKLNVRDLKNGLYYLTVRNGALQRTVRFVKEDMN